MRGSWRSKERFEGIPGICLRGSSRPHFNSRDKVEFSSGLAEAGRGWAASIKLGSMLGRGTGCHGLPLTASLHSGHAQPHSSSPSITISYIDSISSPNFSRPRKKKKESRSVSEFSTRILRCKMIDAKDTLMLHLEINWLEWRSTKDNWLDALSGFGKFVIG